MGHLHYSPFQFANANQVARDDVNVSKVLKTNKKLTKKDAKRAHNMNSTISVADAHEICYNRTPTGFISPNPVGAMKDIHAVFGC